MGVKSTVHRLESIPWISEGITKKGRNLGYINVINLCFDLESCGQESKCTENNNHRIQAEILSQRISRN